MPVDRMASCPVWSLTKPAGLMESFIYTFTAAEKDSDMSK